MAPFDTRKIVFYCGRINRDTGAKAVVHQEQFNKLFTASDRMNNSDGFAEQRQANIVAQSFNRINDELEQEYFYFVIRRVENISTVVGDVPEEYQEYFQDEPVEEPPVDDETTEEPTP